MKGRRTWRASRCRKLARQGTRVSYDLNYRDSLWRAVGGQAGAREVNRALMPYVDVLFGNEEDFAAALGFDLHGVDEHYRALPTGAFRAMIAAVLVAHSRTSRRSPPRSGRRARRTSTAGARWPTTRVEFFEVPQRDVEIFDRVGGGDSFASKFVGLLAGKGAQWALECGVAHGALAMSTPGDTTMATLSEVERAMKGPGARIDR